MPNDHEQSLVTISFPGVTDREASKLAIELEREILEAGAPKNDVKLVRSNPQSMDLGSAIAIGMASTLVAELFRQTAIDAGRQIANGALQKVGGWGMEWLKEKLAEFGRRHDIALKVKDHEGQEVLLGRPHHPAASTSRTTDSPASHSDVGELGAAVLIIVGASRYPAYPELDNPAFARSASAIQELLTTTQLRRVEVLNLFDQDFGTAQIIQKVREHLDNYADARDVIIYYCGHGGYTYEGRYFLTLAGTHKAAERSTGFNLQDLRGDLEKQLIDKRLYMILDCCFSSAAVKAFEAPNIRVQRATDTASIPDRGWAIIAASSQNEVAKAPMTESLTMFTGALAEAIRNGVPNAGLHLNFHELLHQTRQNIQRVHGDASVNPEYHELWQAAGEVLRVPLFQNLAVPEAVPQAKRPLSDAKRRANHDVLNTDDDLSDILSKPSKPVALTPVNRIRRPPVTPSGAVSPPTRTTKIAQSLFIRPAQRPALTARLGKQLKVWLESKKLPQPTADVKDVPVIRTRAPILPPRSPTKKSPPSK